LIFVNQAMNVLARNFYNIFKMAYLPYASSRNGNLKEFSFYFKLINLFLKKKIEKGLSRASLKITAPKYEEKVIFLILNILKNSSKNVNFYTHRI
jgi:hypothetical protein